MSIVSIRRVVKAGFLDFWRNGFVSFASVLMMVFTLLIIGLAMFSGVILNVTFAELQSKSNMSVTFLKDAPEERILELKSSLEALPEVALVTYTSPSEVLAGFRERYQDDQLTLQSLEELGTNPFGAKLTIDAKDILQYDSIANFLREQAALTSEGPSVVDEINFFDPRYHEALTRLQNITTSGRSIGFVVLIIFVIVTVAIAFNTLRLAIYTSRDEISVMRLVGAGKGYIRAPFMIEGVLYGLVAAVIALLLLYPLSWWLGDATATFFGSVNIFHYFISNFLLFFGVIVGSGVVLGAVSSFMAVRRYLKI